MEIVKCTNCSKYYEEDDIQKVEGKYVCFHCVKECKNCKKPFDYDNEYYCYDCLEQDLV